MTQMTESQFIAFRDVTKVFEAAAGDDIEVVEPLSLTIARGEFVVFVGPSGCGKTTVMRMVGGLETPSTGTITLNGKVVDRPSREMGMVFFAAANISQWDRFGAASAVLMPRPGAPDAALPRRWRCG
jgi:ABC-type sugar transport system ATPase subunit